MNFKLFNVRDVNFRELYRGSAVALAVKLGGLFLGYVFSLIIAKFYGASVLGNFLIGVTILNFLVLLSSFGMETTIVAFVAKAKAMADFTGVKRVLREIYRIVVPLSVILLVLAFIAINYFKFYFGELNPTAVRVTNILLIAAIPFTLLRIHTNFFRGLKRILLFSVLNYLALYSFSILFLLIAPFLIDFSEDLLAAIYILAIFLSLLVSIFFVVREINGYPENEAKSYTCREQLPKYSYPILISDLLKNSRNWMVLLLVGYLMTEKDVGVIGIALKLTFAPSLLINAVNSIAMPKFSEQFSLNNIDELKKTLAESARVIFWSSFPILVGIFFFSSFILRFLGNDFNLDSVLILILMTGVFFEVISGSSSYFLQMVGKQKVNTIFLFGSNVILLGMLILLIPEYGIAGAVVSVSVSFILYSGALVIYAKYVMGFNTYYFPLKGRVKKMLRRGRVRG